MRERDAELHVVLPFAEEDFCTERLTYGLPELESWQSALRRVARLPARHAALRHDRGVPQRPGALRLRRRLHAGAGPDAGRPGRRRGHRPGRAGSGDRRESERPGDLRRQLAADRARAARHRPRRRARRRAPDDAARAGPASNAAARATPQRTVRAMLFADVAGFSGLPEPHLPAFFIEFLAIVEQNSKTDADAVPEHLGRRPVPCLR